MKLNGLKDVRVEEPFSWLNQPARLSWSFTGYNLIYRVKISFRACFDNISTRAPAVNNPAFAKVNFDDNFTKGIFSFRYRMDSVIKQRTFYFGYFVYRFINRVYRAVTGSLPDDFDFILFQGNRDFRNITSLVTYIQSLEFIDFFNLRDFIINNRYKVFIIYCFLVIL